MTDEVSSARAGLLDELEALPAHLGALVIVGAQIRPVIQTGAVVMDQLFGAETETRVTQLVSRVVS